MDTAREGEGLMGGIVPTSCCISSTTPACPKVRSQTAAGLELQSCLNFL